MRSQLCPLVLCSHIPWDERGFKGRDDGESWDFHPVGLGPAKTTLEEGVLTGRTRIIGVLKIKGYEGV